MVSRTHIVLLTFAVCSIVANQAIYPIYTKAVNDRPVHALFSPETTAKLTMGYGNMVSTLTWIELIDYFGGTPEESRDYSYIAHMLATVTTMNPYARHAYYMAAVVLPWNTGSITNSDPLLQKAMETYPKDWHWPFYRGFNYYWFEHDEKSAAYYLRLASTKPDSPDFIVNLALRMQTEGNNLDTALAFLDNLLRNRQGDKHIKAQLVQQRNAILTEKILRQIDGLLKKLPHRHHDSRDLAALQRYGVNASGILPDGGKLHFTKSGQLVSSATGKRFKVFVPPRRKVHAP